jgi:hypothetical protein
MGAKTEEKTKCSENYDHSENGERWSEPARTPFRKKRATPHLV